LALLQCLLVVSFSMLYFPNTMFYTISLLVLRVALMYFLASSFCLRVLLFLAVVIVYVGAMIILIGYICAISPNVSFSSRFSSFSFPLLLLLAFHSLSTPPSLSYSPPSDLGRFFYSDKGFFIFIVLFICLFITLLIVTTQYSSPKGPFRSSTV
jgi:hypothetical protein